jgi:hypothetical protein
VFNVSDPFFFFLNACGLRLGVECSLMALSLWRREIPVGSVITLHCHSV